MTPIIRLATVLLLALAVSPLAAEPPGFGPRSAGRPQSAERLVPVKALVDVDRIHPGQRFHVAVELTIEKGWHTYWINPGYSGMPTDVVVKAPAGFRVEPTRYPRPKVIREPEGVTYGYEGKAVLLVPVTAPATLDDGDARFDVDVRWLVCRGICLMGSAQREVTAPTTSTAAATGSVAPAPAIAAHSSRMPRPLARQDGATIDVSGGRLLVRGPARGHASVDLYPIDAPGVTFGPVVKRVEADRFEIEAPLRIEPADALGAAMSVAGLVVLGEKPTDPSFEFSVPLDREGRPTAGATR